MLIGLRHFLGVGVLLCRGNRLLTGSNTRWLRLWEVEAVLGVKPQEKVCNVEDRSVAYSLRIPSIFLNYLKEHAILSRFTQRNAMELVSFYFSSNRVLQKDNILGRGVIIAPFLKCPLYVLHYIIKISSFMVFLSLT